MVFEGLSSGAKTKIADTSFKWSKEQIVFLVHSDLENMW